MFHLIGYTTTAIPTITGRMVNFLTVTHACEWTGYPSASTNKCYMYACLFNAITGDHKLLYPQRKVIMIASPSTVANKLML